MENVSPSVDSRSDQDVFGAVADYFADSRFDLDTFLQRLSRKDRLSSLEIAEDWSRLVNDFWEGKKPAHINLYIHIPFCRHHCAYCGYYTLTPDSKDVVGRYLEGLAAQAQFFSKIIGKVKIRNLFVGGGTPSLMSVHQTKFFVDNVLAPFRYQNEGQRTIECDPFTLTPEKIRVYKGSVLRRASMGVESLNETVLDALGRTVRGESTGLSAVRMLKDEGFDHDLNCDLILGLVNDTPESFLRSFRGLLEQGVAKIIVYALKPIPAYLEKFYDGKWENFHRHYEGLLARVQEPLKEIAEEFGYIQHKNSDVVWYYIERSDTKGSALLRYEDDSSFLPLSVMGLGSSARSRIYGYARYTQAHRLLERFDSEEPIYLGQRMGQNAEMVRMILTSLRNRKEISLSKFESKFKCSLLDVFQCVVDRLTRDGRAFVKEGHLRLSTQTPRETLLAGMAFVGREEVEGAFSDILQGLPEAKDGSRPVTIKPMGEAVSNGHGAVNRPLVLHVAAGGEIAQEKLTNAIEDAYENGLRRVCVLGGDPSAVPYLIDGMRQARSLGFKEIRFILDGEGWADRSYLEKISNAGVTDVGIVVHGVSEKRVALLQKSLDEGLFRPPLELHAVVSQATLPHVRTYIEHYRAAGVEAMRFHFIGPQFPIRFAKETVPPYEDAMKEIEGLINSNESQWRMNLTFGGFPACVLRWCEETLSPHTWHHWAKTYLGRQEDWSTPVGEHVYLREGRDPRLKYEKILPAGCRSCTFLGTCEGVWNFYPKLYGEEALMPVTEK